MLLFLTKTKASLRQPTLHPKGFYYLKMNMKLNLSADLALIISIITVFLFANGNAYLGGYLSAFNVDPIVLNFSIQDKIYIGYLNGFHYLMYLVYGLTLYIVVKHIWISFRVNSYAPKLLANAFPDTGKKKNAVRIHNSTYNEEIESSYFNNTIFLVGIVILLVVTLLSLSKTETTAQEEAFTKLEKFDFRKVALKTSQDKIEYFHIKCGSTLCALITKDKKIVLEEPKNITSSPRKKAP